MRGGGDAAQNGMNVCKEHLKKFEQNLMDSNNDKNIRRMEQGGHAVGHLPQGSY
jgi:hypothetical protein